MRTRFLALVFGFFAFAAAPAAIAQNRVALVVGESAYDDKALPTAANDAGLVAQDLRTAGFDIVQGADLDLTALRKSVRDFLDRVEAAGPGTTALVYFSGRGVQFEGENFLVPVGARIDRVSDIPIEAFRLSDLMRSLEGLPVDLRIVMLDAGRPFPAPQDNQPLARGLALVDPSQGFAVSFSTAPGEVAEDGQGPYGPYATAFVEMIRQPGLSLPDLFGRIRLRVHELTQGAQTPWDVVKSDTPFVFLAPQEGAAVPPPPPPPPARDFASVGDQEAYGIALERDTIPAYQDFLRAYPDSTFAPRVKRLLAQRREALTWQRTVARDTPDAYWTYLKRYPRGLHAADARRRLARLSAAAEPPPDFGGIEYDLPPPLAGIESYEWEDRYDYPLPPPPPVYILPPPPREVVILPPPPREPGYLPIPVPIPVPGWVRPPRPPRDPIVIVPGLDRPRPRPPVVIDPGFQQGRPDPARPSLLQPPPGSLNDADRRRWEQQQQQLLREEQRRIREQRRNQEEGIQQRLQDQRRQEELLRRDQQQQQIDRRQEEFRRRQQQDNSGRAREDELRRRAIDQQRQRDLERGQDVIRRDRQQQLQQREQQLQEQQRRMMQQRDREQDQQQRMQREMDRRQQQDRQRQQEQMQQRQQQDRQRQQEQMQQRQQQQEQMRRQNEDRQRQQEQMQQRQQQIQQQQQRQQEQMQRQQENMRRQQEQQQRQQENMQRMMQQRQHEQRGRGNECGQAGLPPCR